MNQNILSDAAGWVIIAFMAALATVIVLKMIKGANGGIDLKLLVSEEDGTASLSRFQFLIFTFVVAMGLLVITLKSGNFPTTVGSDVLGLLGISAGSYVGSKITHKVAKPSGSPQPVQPAATAQPAPAAPAVDAAAAAQAG